MSDVSNGADTSSATGACKLCGGQTENRRVDISMQTARGLVVIEDVPVLACKECEEQFYDEATTGKIQQLFIRGFPRAQLRREIVVPVYALSESEPAQPPKDMEL